MTGIRVGGLTPFTTIDFPGRLAAVVWCQGCPWRCRYCHNGHLLSRDVSSALEWGEVLAFLRQRRGLLDAVVFSGGEPTVQKSLDGAMREIRQLGFDIALHTAGCYPDRLASLLPFVDWVGLDIKALPGDYAGITGVPGSGEKAWRSLEVVLASGVSCEVRVTVHDALLSREQAVGLVGTLHGLGVQQIVLQRCGGHGLLDDALPAPGSSWAGGAGFPMLAGEGPPVITRS